MSYDSDYYQQLTWEHNFSDDWIMMETCLFVKLGFISYSLFSTIIEKVGSVCVSNVNIMLLLAINPEYYKLLLIGWVLLFGSLKFISADGIIYLAFLPQFGSNTMSILGTPINHNLEPIELGYLYLRHAGVYVIKYMNIPII